MKQTIVFTTLSILMITATIDSKGQSLKKKEIKMEKTDFTTTIIVEQTPTLAFNAIKDFRAWWSEEIEGSTDKLNEAFFYHYKDVHLCKLKLIELVPDKKLVYQVIDNQFSFVKDTTEWINTKLIFDITKMDGKTKVIFTHQGLVPEYECYNVCQDAWTSYIQGSLQSLINTGKGKPNAKEGGLNAELVQKWGLPSNPNKSNNMKQQKDFTTSIVVDKSATEVFNAINDVRSWWQGEIKGNTEKLNDEFTYQMAEFHLTKQKIVEFVPDKRIVWLVTESKINFVADKEEWLNTRIIFDISKEGTKTKLTFTHQGLVPAIECYEGCAGAWESLIDKSLFSFIMTGKGVDVF